MSGRDYLEKNILKRKKIFFFIVKKISKILPNIEQKIDHKEYTQKP